jgi:hypothetical protein
MTHKWVSHILNTMEGPGDFTSCDSPMGTASHAGSRHVDSARAVVAPDSTNGNFENWVPVQVVRRFSSPSSLDVSWLESRTWPFVSEYLLC